MPRGPRQLARSQVLLDVFGVSYSDGRERFLPFNVLCNWPAMMFRVPVVKLSHAAARFSITVNPRNNRTAWKVRATP